MFQRGSFAALSMICLSAGSRPFAISAYRHLISRISGSKFSNIYSSYWSGLNPMCSSGIRGSVTVSMVAVVSLSCGVMISCRWVLRQVFSRLMALFSSVSNSAPHEQRSLIIGCGVSLRWT